MKIYSCEPIRQLNYCDKLYLDIKGKDKTTFVFLKEDKKYKLTLSNDKYVDYGYYISFNFFLKGEHIIFAASECTDFERVFNSVFSNNAKVNAVKNMFKKNPFKKYDGNKYDY